MRLTHFGHSCVLVELNGSKILFDPGNFSHGFEGITGLDAILVTHQHPDHADPARLPELAEANPDAVLYSDPQTAEARWALDGSPAGRPVQHRRRRGDRDRRRARDHPSGPTDDRQHRVPPRRRHQPGAVHASRRFPLRPRTEVDVLALPAAAPWLKISEAIDYLRAVAPRVAVPIHQAIIRDEATGIFYGRYSEMAADGTEFEFSARSRASKSPDSVLTHSHRR